MQRKVFTNGNSLVVFLPKEVLEPLGGYEGSQVSVELDRPNGQILIRPSRLPPDVRMDEAFARQVSEFIVESRPALNALAKK